MMRRNAEFLLVLSLLPALALVAGCGVNSGISAGRADSPTRGAAVSILITDRESSHGLYIVEPDGTIAFGGGFDALNNRTSWNRTLTGEELTRLHEALLENGWLRARPVAPAGGEGPLHHVRFAAPGVGWQIRTRSPGPEVTAVRDLIIEIARTRHQEFLQQLPPPGPLD